MELKFFVLVDYTTGIVLFFASDEGQYSRVDFGHLPWGATGQVFLIILVDDYKHTNRCIITDNYYTSVSLSKELLRRGLYHIGTCQLRKGIPNCVKMSNKRPTKNCPKGTFNLAVSTTGGLKVAAIGVMDNAACYFLDSKYGHHPFQVRRRNRSGEFDTLNVVKGMEYYNRYMGAVDQFDQMRCGRLGITMRSKRNKWTVRYFETMLDFMKEQAYRIWAVMYNGTPKELNHYEANDSLQSWLADPLINPYVQATSSGQQEEEKEGGGGGGGEGFRKKNSEDP